LPEIAEIMGLILQTTRIPFFMAGPYTHLTIAHGAMLDAQLSPELAELLQVKASYVYVGALSPDMPYASLDTQYSDMYHRRDTGRVLQAGLELLRRHRLSADYSTSALHAMEAWLYGYASHLVIDTFLHPVNQATVAVGGREMDPLRHRECEMAQDILLVSDVHADDVEICTGAYSYTLRMALDSDEISDVAEFWESIHDTVYGDLAPDTGPRLWIPSFIEIIELIEKGQAVQHLTRHINNDLGQNVQYVAADALRSDRPDLVADYYEHVHLPDGASAHFLNDVFPAAVDAVLGLWDLMEGVLNAQDDELEVRFDSWDLDRGVELSSDEMVFWRGSVV
jgi:hypothetical protein